MTKAAAELLIKAIERVVVGNYSTMGSASADEVFKLLEEAEKELAKMENKKEAEKLTAKNNELLKIIEQLKQDLDRSREECRQLDRNAKATQDEYKREIERLEGDLKSKRQHEVCRLVRKNIYPIGKSEPLKIVSFRAVPRDAIYESMGDAIANYINQHGQPPQKICVSTSLLSLMQDELAPGLKDKTIAKFMGVPGHGREARG